MYFHLFSFMFWQPTDLSNHWRKYFQFTREKMANQEAAKIVMAGMAAQPIFVWVHASDRKWHAIYELFFPPCFYLRQPIASLCLWCFHSLKGTIRHCGKGTGADNCGPFTAWPGVYGRVWWGWWEGQSILPVQWEPCPNDGNARCAGPGEGPSARAPYHGPCWTGEKRLLLFEIVLTYWL